MLDIGELGPPRGQSPIRGCSVRSIAREPLRMHNKLHQAASLLAAILMTGTTPHHVQTHHSMSSHGRYMGAPDLALTSAMLTAGGGAATFHATTLLGVLAGPHTSAEMKSLTRRFGKARVAQFASTYDAFVSRAVTIVQDRKIDVPAPSPALTHNGWMLSASLRHAGVMPDGRFDVGYMLEHLLSRPMHKALMTQVNADPKFGPEVNANFHVVLTAVMDDLKKLYRLPS